MTNQSAVATIAGKLDRLAAKLAAMEPIRPLDLQIAIEAGRDALAVAGQTADAVVRTEPYMPARADAVAKWLRGRRDQFEQGGDAEWDAINQLLRDYWLHADTRTPLHEHACSGAVCQCAEAPGGSRP